MQGTRAAASEGGPWPLAQGQGRCLPDHAAAVLEDGDGRYSGLAEPNSGGAPQVRSAATALRWTASGWQRCGGSVGQLMRRRSPAGVPPEAQHGLVHCEQGCHWAWLSSFPGEPGSCDCEHY